jgi:peroxiredoxin
MSKLCTALLLLAIVSGDLAARERAARVDKKSEEVLRRLERYYRSVQTVGVKVSCATTIQSGGGKQEMFCSYDASIARPNKVAIIPAKCTEGTMATTLVSDGATGVVAYSDYLKRHVKRLPVESLDEIFWSEDMSLVNRTLASMFMLNYLMQGKPYEAILRQVNEVRYVADELLDGQACDHLSFIENDVTWELWVDQGKAPLLRKVVPDVSKLMAADSGMKTDVLVKFSDWKIDQPIADAAFQFALPKNSLRIDSFYEDDDVWRKRLLGKAAPISKLKLHDGAEHNLSADRGNIVILDFWSIWCVPCCKQLPALVEIAAAYKDRNVVLYTVHEDNDLEPMRAYLKKQGLAMNVAMDAERALATSYRVIGIPQTVLIDKDGTVQAIHVGGNDNIKAELTRELETLLAGKKLVK